MSSRSLRLRLLLAATVAIAIALSASGWVLAQLFARHTEAREFAELRNHQNQLIAGLEIAADGTPHLVSQPADPRFEAPNGGLYWQIDDPTGSAQRSRSLWETELKLPIDDLRDGIPHSHLIAGPANQTLFAVERSLTLGPESNPRTFRITVAVDRKDVDNATAEFRNVLLASLGTLGAALIAASLLQIQIGLQPLVRLRHALQRVHSGDTNSITGDFASEVTPLIADMNALLDRERKNNTQARERAADLAHGFKTPLTVLSAVARELERNERAQLATEIKTQIDLMGRHVSRELARARTVGASPLRRNRTPVKASVDKIVAALSRITADRGLAWQVDVPHDAIFSGDENDLLELIGNLAENAAKWATSTVSIRARRHDQTLNLEILDDGPGIPEGTEAEVLMRGRRLDQTTEGNGLGLSIVAKIVKSYSGTMRLERGQPSGLSVQITLPA